MKTEDKTNTHIIECWEELDKLESETHVIEIDLYYGCGWIVPRKESIDDNSYDDRHYLSTHAFYPNTYKATMKMLKDCGFDVELIPCD